MGAKLKTWVVVGLLLGTMAYAMATDYVAWEIYPSPTGNYYDLRVANTLTVGDEATDQAIFNATTVKAPNGLLVLTGIAPNQYPSLSMNGTTGRVGIGIVTPNSMLHVVDASPAGPAVRIDEQSVPLLIRTVGSSGAPDKYWRIASVSTNTNPTFSMLALQVSNTEGFTTLANPLQLFPVSATETNIVMRDRLQVTSTTSAGITTLVPGQQDISLGGDAGAARLELRQSTAATPLAGPYIDFADSLLPPSPTPADDYDMRIMLEGNNVLAIRPGTPAGGTLRLPNLGGDPTITPNAPGALYYNVSNESTRVLRSTGWTDIVSVGGGLPPSTQIPPCVQASCSTHSFCTIPSAPAPPGPGTSQAQIWDACFLRGAELAEDFGACLVEQASVPSGWRIRAGTLNTSSCGSGSPQVSTCYAVCLKF